MTALRVLNRDGLYRQSSVRECNAEGLALIQGARTNEWAADELGWSEATVVAVRRRGTGMTADLTWRAAFNSGSAFIAPHLAWLGMRAVPLDATCTTDTGVQTDLARVALKIAVALDPASPGGAVTTEAEARDMVPDIRKFMAHCDRLLRLANSSVAA